MKESPIQPVSLEKLRRVVRQVCEPYEVSRVELFGSLASGKAQPGSDVDLLVTFEPDAHAGLFEMGQMKEALEAALDCTVDLLSRDAIERSPNVYRRQAILTNTVSIYAR